jgi:hypothetical protein
MKLFAIAAVVQAQELLSPPQTTQSSVSSAFSEFFYNPKIILKYLSSFISLTLPGNLTNLLSIRIPLNMAERTEARSAKRSLASKYLKF